MKDYLNAILSGLLLAFAFPRFNLEVLAWFALVPLLFAIYPGDAHRALKLGFVAGLVFYFITLSWVTNTLVNYGNIPTVVSWLILSLLVSYLSVFVGLFAYGINRFSKGHPLNIFLLAPVIWTALEYLRSTHSIYGFSWQGLGYSQFQSLPVIQMASITGVYGISALIVLVNTGLFVLLNPAFEKYPVWKNSRKRIAVSTFALLLLCVGYGKWTLGQEPVYSTPPVRVGLIQGNIPQEMKWNPVYRNEVLNRYRNLTLKAAAFKPDLMVWPEAVTPFFFNRDVSGTQYVMDTVRQAQTPMVLGSPARKNSQAVSEQQCTSLNFITVRILFPNKDRSWSVTIRSTWYHSVSSCRFVPSCFSSTRWWRTLGISNGVKVPKCFDWGTMDLPCPSASKSFFPIWSGNRSNRARAISSTSPTMPGSVKAPHRIST